MRLQLLVLISLIMVVVICEPAPTKTPEGVDQAAIDARATVLALTETSTPSPTDPPGRILEILNDNFRRPQFHRI